MRRLTFSTFTLVLALTAGLAAASSIRGQEAGAFRTAAIDLDLDVDYEMGWLDGRATYEIRGRSPVPFLNLTAAPYHVHEQGGGVRAYLLPGDLDLATPGCHE